MPQAPQVRFLIGDGEQANAGALVTRVSAALTAAHLPAAIVTQFQEECRGADYSQLLAIIRRWVTVV